MSRSSITLSIATWIRSARSGSSLIATMPRWRARDQAEVDGLGVAERAALGDLHRVDVADQVGDAGVRGGQLLGVPLVAVPPRDRQVVAELGGAALRGVGDRLVGVLAELGAGDHRRPLVEQADQGAQQPGLALAALAEQHDVVAGDQRPLELRDHGVLEAVQPGPGVAALAAARPAGCRGSPRAADLWTWPRRAELADGLEGGCVRHGPQTTQPANRPALRARSQARDGSVRSSRSPRPASTSAVDPATIRSFSARGHPDGLEEHHPCRSGCRSRRARGRPRRRTR